MDGDQIVKDKDLTPFLLILVVAQGSRNWPAAVCVGRERVQIVKGRLDYVDDQAL